MVEHLTDTERRARAGRWPTRSGSTSTSGPASRSARCPPPGGRPALDAAGNARDDAQVAELTGLLRRGRRRRPARRLAGRHAHPGAARDRSSTGAQLSLFEQINGYRYQLIATTTRGGQAQRLEARHRVHARVEGFIRCGKDTGLASWPSHSFAINTAWVQPRSPSRSTCCAGCGCCCWTARWPRPNRRRCATGCCTPPPAWSTDSRHLILRIPETWPWAQEFADAFNRVLAIP